MAAVTRGPEDFRAERTSQPLLGGIRLSSALTDKFATTLPCENELFSDLDLWRRRW
jgi:hypothetical protein